MMSNEEEEKILPTSIAQEEEMESMVAIFADGFTLLSSSREPISYSIHLQTKEFNNNDISRLRLPDDLRLTVSYPSTYPDNDIPTFDILYDKTNITLHEIQVRAILKTVATVAQENLDIGMPCVYSCVQAAKEFLTNGGLDQAGLALLSDDSLACILSYLATSKEDIDEICITLPILENAARQNVVWKQLCQRRWREKWGYKQRWERALENFNTQPDEHYWMNTYNNEEEDAKRTYLTRDELCNLTFDWRDWFKQTPQNGLLSTGVGLSLLTVVFSPDGNVSSYIPMNQLMWKTKGDNDVGISCISLGRHGRERAKLHVIRLTNWGWELRDQKYYILRAVDEVGLPNVNKLWEDLTANIIVQERPEWIKSTRSRYEINRREVPDDEDCKALPW